MEIRTFAERILLSESLEEKLTPPPACLSDDSPGEPIVCPYPGRPEELRFTYRQRGVKMPHYDAFHEPRLRATAHHIMANHELQALEVMAWVLCAFPDAPKGFRVGLVDVLKDEQRHTRMHMARLKSMGAWFGQHKVNGYVWMKAQDFTGPMDYCAGLALTFEGGNLDHSLEFAELFEKNGDRAGADVMRRIHQDEIEHVAFGLKWLRELKPTGQSDWEAFVAHLHHPLKPQHALGKNFQKEARFQTGMDPQFVQALERLWHSRWGDAAHPESGLT